VNGDGVADVVVGAGPTMSSSCVAARNPGTWTSWSIAAPATSQGGFGTSIASLVGSGRQRRRR
jgi:hypothetical protein